ncbi:MAG: hypothetical protein KC593_19110 [Myxococcales bacterium]|nr:hypothetical protein [Myxococcales bacterium]MCB9626626.1 hypothetical protein [Sandaracinaceae bacterium]
MSTVTRWVSLVGVVAMVGCGGGAEETASGGGEATTGSEAQGPAVVARFEGDMVEGVPVIIELDDANGGSMTSTESGVVTTFSECAGEGAVLTCRTSSGANEGDIELTRQDGGASVRARLHTDNVWVEFNVTDIEL